MKAKKQETVLITGGSGLVGRHLIPLLLDAGYRIRILSRKKREMKNAESFIWDIHAGTIEEGAVEGLDHIIHLAGENMGEGRWTKSKKKSIIDSRVLSARLLFDTVEKRNPDLKSFTSASATGYYGALSTEYIFKEPDPPGLDFAARVCVQWEEAASLFRSGGYRTSVVRTGVVLTKEGGMLGRVLPTIKLRFSPLFGNGRHYLPWIHIDDLCGIYLKIVNDADMDGIYNAVAPEHIRYKHLVKTLSVLKKKKVLMPPTPELPWRIMFGEKASMLLEGSRVSSEKIIKAGYDFRYPRLREALKNIISKDKQ